MARTLFVSRNAGAADWAAKNKYRNVEVVETFAPEMVESGDLVIGTLPLALAAVVTAKSVKLEAFALDFSPEMRGKNLSCEDLEQANARVLPVEVKEVLLEPTSKNIVVTRHAGAVEWLKRQGISAEVKAHFTDADMEEVDQNVTIIGVLPINMVAEVNKRGGKFISLDIRVPKELWKTELDADKMEELGAKLTPYEVKIIS